MRSYWAVYAGETPVGFVMISDEVGAPGYIPQYLWKLLIDSALPRAGFGTATLDLVRMGSCSRQGAGPASRFTEPAPARALSVQLGHRQLRRDR